MPLDPANKSLVDGANAFIRQLRRGNQKQVKSKPLRATIQDYIRQYFENGRSVFPPSIRESDQIKELDDAFQDLMRCTHAQTTATRYVKVLQTIVQNVQNLEIVALPTTDTPKINPPHHDHDQLILDTLQKLTPAAKLAFEQGLRDLNGPDRVSWRGSAVEFREALREVLDTLAPDKDVISQPGYKQEKDVHGPTMKQKTVFILKSRGAPSSELRSLTDSVNIVDEMVGNFVRSVYQRSSNATHTTTTKPEVQRIRDYVTLALKELLEIKQGTN